MVHSPSLALNHDHNRHLTGPHLDAELESLLESLRPDLERRIRALRDRSADAHGATEDLVAAAISRFLQSVRARGGPTPTRGEAWGLLSAIAQGLVVDHLRRHHVRTLALVRLRRELRADGAVGPDSIAELREILDRALAAMSPDERALVVRRMRGASWAMIAREAGASEEAVRQRWAALRRRLRTLAGDA